MVDPNKLVKLDSVDMGIMSILLNSEKFLTKGEISYKLKATIPATDSTIYQKIDILSREGFIIEHNEGGKKTYEDTGVTIPISIVNFFQLKIPLKELEKTCEFVKKNRKEIKKQIEESKPTFVEVMVKAMIEGERKLPIDFKEPLRSMLVFFMQYMDTSPIVKRIKKKKS